MEIYYDTAGEKVYINFNDLCEALRRDYKKYCQNDDTLAEWVESMLNDEIYVYDISDDEISYLDADGGIDFTEIKDLEDYAIDWDDYSGFVEEYYTQPEILLMSDNEKEDIKQKYLDYMWNEYFEDVGCIYKIDPKSKEVKKCFNYNDLF